MKKMIRGIVIGLFVLMIPLAAMGAVTAHKLPDSFTAVPGKSFQIETGVPVSVDLPEAGSVAAQSSQSGHVPSTCQASVKMFGIIPLKNVEVNLTEEIQVIPCGTPFGLKLFTDGVVVVGFTDVDTKEGNINPGECAGLQTGDSILSINGTAVENNQQAASLIEHSGGTPLKLKIQRGDQSFETQLQPLYSESANCYKAGLWIRDSSAGIGTMTFVCPETGLFGALGHGVCDADTLDLLPMMNGDVVLVKLIGITKGTQGAAGELKGYFSTDIPQGSLISNTETGVYGSLSSIPEQEALPVAMKQEIQRGSAQILTTISGESPKLYDITIEKVNYQDGSPTKNMVIRITDPELLQETGGIVQGMSGSPIIQNGKLIGAVTHVFINDPKKGYAIFAENMLQEIQNIPIESSNNAA